MDEAEAEDPWGDAVAAGERFVSGATPGLAERLDAWVADARIERSVDARAREHWLRAAADADATFAGVLLDLAERGAGLTVATVAGRRHHGVVQVIGADFVALRGESGRELLLSLAAIASVRTTSAAAAATGERVVTTDLRMSDVLGELAAERMPVRILVLDATEAVTGELRTVGQDVVTVRTDGEAPGTAYLRTGAVVEVALG